MKTLYYILISILSITNLVFFDTNKYDSTYESISLGEEFESTREHNIFKYTNNNDKAFLFYIQHEIADSTIVEIYNENKESLIYTGGTYSKTDSVRQFTLNVGETAYIKFNKENIKAIVMLEDIQIKATINGQVMDKMFITLEKGNVYKLGFLIYDETLDKFVDYNGDVLIYSVSKNLYPTTGNQIVIPEDALVGYAASFKVESITFNIEIE